MQGIRLVATRKPSPVTGSTLPPFELSLRIRHPSMRPADLSRELGLEAKHSFCAGEPREARGAQTTPASVHAESYWLGSLDAIARPADPWLGSALGSAIAFGVVRFLRSKAALLERIHKEGGEVSLLVALSPTAVGSFILQPEVTRTFGELKVTVEFEMVED